MFRSIGSIIFGIAADRYGRKWPFIVNNILFIILELVSETAIVVNTKSTKLFAAASRVLGCNDCSGAA